MLKFITPDTAKDKTEEEFFQDLDEEYAGDRTYRIMKSFISSAREAHRSMHQVIHCMFDKSVFGRFGVDTHRVLLLDPAYPDRRPIGIVTYRGYEEQYEIYNRKTTVSRGDTYKRMRADRSKNLDKAVSIFKKQVTLYADEEVADLSHSEAYEAIISWLAEINVYSTLLQNSEHVEEMSNLIQQGVTFKTETYKNAVEHLPNAIERLRRRGIVNCEMVYVVETKNRGLFIGRNGSGTVYKYASLEQLPEILLGKFSLLRIMPPSTHLPEVGYRTADGVSWLVGIRGEEWGKFVMSRPN